MSIKHIIQCDGPTCGKEQALETIQARHPGAKPEYRRPDGWPSFDGYDFCSYFCASAYADDREKHPEKYQARPSLSSAVNHLSTCDRRPH